MDWEVVAAISSAIATIIVLAASIFAYSQLTEMRRSSQLTAFVNTTQFLQEERIRQARKTLINLKGKPFEQWTPEEIHDAELACSRFHIVGIMIKNKLIKEDLIIPEWQYSITMCWEAVQPMLEKYQAERGPTYWINFENLYKLATQCQRLTAETNNKPLDAKSKGASG